MSLLLKQSFSEIWKYLLENVKKKNIYISEVKRNDPIWCPDTEINNTNKQKLVLGLYFTEITISESKITISAGLAVLFSALAVGVCTQTIVWLSILAWLVCMLQPGRVEGRAVKRKPLKCFPICPADSADFDSRTPVPQWLTFPPTLCRNLHPIFFSCSL